MKKAELQMQESILALFIFFIILAISLVFFYQYQSSSINADNFRYEQTRYAELLATIPNLPDLKCSSLTDEEDCIDTLKLLSFNQEKHDFGKRAVRITLLNPAPEIICTEMNYPDCNVFLLYDNTNNKEGSLIKSPVSLLYPVTDEYKPALLEIRWQI